MIIDGFNPLEKYSGQNIPPGIDRDEWFRALKEFSPGQERTALADTFDEPSRRIILAWLEKNPEFQPKPIPRGLQGRE